jgi:hypothetical protein
VIFRKLLMAFVAIAFLATSAAIVAVAVSFALYALVLPYVGAAGASAVVAGVYALILAIGGLAVMPRGRNKRRAGTGTPAGVAEDLMELVRDKPIASAGVALAAGIMAMRNPRVIGEIARAFFQNRRPPR